MRRLSEAVKQWQKETGYAFSLYSTPSENLCDRFCRLDTKQFGVIEGVTDKGYYTNSYHLDVEKKVNPYDKLDFEMPYPETSKWRLYLLWRIPNIQHNLKDSKMCGIIATIACLITALIRQLMNVMNVVLQESLIAQVKALSVRNAVIMTVQKSP